jgi:hypothetical protein
MSDSRPVRRVVELLKDNGYVPVHGDLRVGTISFNFAEVLFGTQNSCDLVVVVDTVFQPSESRTRRQVESLARALDIVQSRRSLTLIVVGPQLSDNSVRDLSRVCRILAVGTPTGRDADRVVRDVLAILLPLDLPVGEFGIADPLTRLRAELDDFLDVEVEPFIEAAQREIESVEAALKQWLLDGISSEVP